MLPRLNDLRKFELVVIYELKFQGFDFFFYLCLVLGGHFLFFIGFAFCVCCLVLKHNILVKLFVEFHQAASVASLLG